MNQADILEQTESYVRSLCERESRGHDWWHIDRVRRIALVIAQQEGADCFIVEMASLLHDVADKKFNPSLESGLDKVATFLDSQEVAADEKQHILYIIATMSFSSQKEGKVGLCKMQTVSMLLRRLG